MLKRVGSEESFYLLEDDHSKTISRKTTKNYHPRADDPLLLKFANISVLRLYKEDEKP